MGNFSICSITLQAILKSKNLFKVFKNKNFPLREFFYNKGNLFDPLIYICFKNGYIVFENPKVLFCIKKNQKK